MSPSFSSASVSESYRVLDLHATAVTNGDSNDDQAVIFELDWCAVLLGNENHTSVNWQTFSTYALYMSGTYDEAAQGKEIGM